MSLAADFDLEVTFDLTGTQPKFIFTDGNNYLGNGDTLQGGFISVIAPTGDTIYQTDPSSPDITSSQLTFDSLLVPTDTQGAVLAGQYSFTYTAETLNNPIGFNKAKQFDFQFCTPKGSIEVDVDCLAARLQSRDATSYAVNGISPNFTRVHEIHVPTIQNVGPVSGNGSLVQVLPPNLYEGVHTVKIDSLLDYPYPDGFVVRTRVLVQQDFTVQCDVNLCKIFCCVSAVKSRLNRYRCENPALYER